MPKYYLVSADVFESNFPDEFEKMIEDKQVKAFEITKPVSEQEVISNQVLAALEDVEEKMIALTATGVQDWEGYETAMDIYRNKNSRE